MTCELDGLEPVEPRREHRLDRGRQHDLRDVADRLPAGAVQRDQPLVQEHARRLLDEERVALGGLGDAGGDLRRDVVAEQVRDQRPGRRLRERVEHDRPRRRRARQEREVLGQVRARRADDQDRRAALVLEQVLDEPQERRLGPVQVVEEDQHGPLPRQRLEQAADGPGDLLRAREHVVEADRAGEPGDDEVRLRHARQQREQLLACRIAGVAVLDPRERLQHDREREVGDPLAVGDAAALEHGGALADDCGELVGEPRLPGAGVAEQGDRPARALTRPPPRRPRAARPVRASDRRAATRAGARGRARPAQGRSSDMRRPAATCPSAPAAPARRP